MLLLSRFVYLTMGILATVAVMSLTSIRPYSDVELQLKTAYKQEYVDLDYLFYKPEGFLLFFNNQCKFNQLEVVGLNLGVPTVLEWKNRDGRTDGVQTRPAGVNLLSIRVFVEGVTYTDMQIRVRHLCGEGQKVVDTIFVTERL